MTRNRKKLDLQTEADVLTKSRHRCALCFGLHRDTATKQGQIAHLDQDPSNSDSDNLAFLCLDHHDGYDSTTSQSKNFTVQEVKRYRDELYKFLSSPAFGVHLEPAGQEVLSAVGNLRVIAKSVHTSKRCEVFVGPEDSLRFLAEKLQAALGLYTKADTGSYAPFLLRWILVDTQAIEEWRSIPKGERFYIYAVVRSPEGLQISKSPRDRLKEAGVYDGITLHLYPIEEDSEDFPMHDPAAKMGY